MWVRISWDWNPSSSFLADIWFWKFWVKILKNRIKCSLQKWGEVSFFLKFMVLEGWKHICMTYIGSIFYKMPVLTFLNLLKRSQGGNKLSLFDSRKLNKSMFWAQNCNTFIAMALHWIWILWRRSHGVKGALKLPWLDWRINGVKFRS